MKICVIGAGAIGGLLAARLSHAGHDVGVVARGAHLAAIRANGLILRADGAEIVAPVFATDKISEIGAPDLVVLALKGHQVGAVAAELGAALAPSSLVLTAQNGVPWWYFCKTGGAREGVRLESADPGGIIAAHLPVDNVIGGVVYLAAEIEAPGIVRHSGGNRLVLGELDGALSERIEAVSQAFARAGIMAPVSDDLRSELWTKLWGNLSFNPISALTHATLADICRHPLARALAADMMTEAQAVGEALGAKFRLSLDQRIAGAEAVGAHKTSMLQDIENGRAIEAEALIGAVIELARLVAIPTPHIDAVYALAKLLDQSLATTKGRLAIAV